MPCSDSSWHGLWDAFNTHTTDVIRVPRAALAEVGECHEPMGVSRVTGELIARAPREGSKTVEVYRSKLFAFLSAHPGKCEAP